MNNLELKEIQDILSKNQKEIADLLEISKSAYQKYIYKKREIPRKIELKALELLKKHNNSHNYTHKEVPHVDLDGVIFGLNDAIKLIFDNLKEAEKMPLMRMYKENIEQRAIIEERDRMYQEILKLKQKQDETQN